jgi:hypothetical protein
MVDPKIALIVEYALRTAVLPAGIAPEQFAARNSGISYCCWLFLAVIRRSCSLLFFASAVEKPVFPGLRPNPWLFFFCINSVQRRLHWY